MTRYTVAETYLYEIVADSLDEALERFHIFMETGDSETTGVVFVDNETATYDESGAAL